MKRTCLRQGSGAASRKNELEIRHSGARIQPMPVMDRNLKSLRQFFCQLALVLLVTVAGLTSCGRKEQPDPAAIREAVKDGSLGKVKTFLDDDPDLLYCRERVGTTLLHIAADNGRKDVAGLLLDRGMDVNVNNNYRDEPLHMAARGGFKDVAQLLLDRGANINAADTYGDTPLHLAADNGHLDVAELLLAKGANINAQDKNGWTPLHWAVESGHKDVVEFLLKSQADVNVKDNSGRTPLKLAFSSKYMDIADLLAKYGAH